MDYNEEQGVARTYPIDNKVWKEFKVACKHKGDIQSHIQNAVVLWGKQLFDIQNNKDRGPISHGMAKGSSKTFRITHDKWDKFKDVCNELGLVLKQQVQESIIAYTEKLNKG